MALTPNLSTVTVGGQFVDVAGSPIAGQVKFTPRTILTDPVANQIIIPKTITVDLDANGSFTLVLPVTDDADVTPTGFTYRVEEAFTGGRVYDITLPSSPATQNLADMAPAVPQGSTEASTYVLLSTFGALETRVGVVETVTSVVQGVATQLSTAVSQATAAAQSADDLESKNLHPFIFLGI